MNVLHVIPGLARRTGGPAVAVVQAARALEACGVPTTIFATDMAGPASASEHRPVSRDELADGLDGLDARLFPARPPYRLAYSPALGAALRRELGRYDVVHVHSLYLFPQFAAYREAVRRGVPYVVSPSGALDPYLRRRSRVVKAVANAVWQRRMLDEAALLHFKTQEEADLVADLRLAPPAFVAPNGIRWADFEELPPRDDFRRRRLRGHDGPVVLSLGRLSHKKGLDVLIRAFALVRGEIPDALLVLAGPDDEGRTPSLRALAEELGVGAAVVFTGMLHGRDIVAALSAADVWALSSHTENFGLAVVEALAARLPVVVSPAVNVAPEIAAAGAGVVAPLEPAAFAAEIVALLRDAERRSLLGGRAREFARRYDWAAVAQRWVEMYAAARGDGRERRAA